MIYQENYGDVIKKMPEYVTAHCISEDCGMGQGVVLAFRKAFPGLKDICLKHVENNMERINGVIPPCKHMSDDKIVYNMFTKSKYWHRAGKYITYEKYLENLKNSLELVRDDMLKNNETKIAMPKIGSGLDRCNWKDVREIINEVFGETEIEVFICLWNS